MRKIVFLVGLVSFLSVAECSVNAQWIASTGLDGGSCDGAGILDSTLFVTATGNGVFFRKVNSTIWDQALVPGGFSEVIVTGPAVFVFGAMTGCYRSLDSGLSWQKMDTILSPVIYSMVSVDTILFYSEGGAIYRSDDLGNSHYSVSDSLAGLVYPYVYFSNGILFCSDSYPSLKLYSSPDLGNTWDSLTQSGLPPDAVEAMCMATYNGRIWLTINSGLFYFDTLAGNWVQYSDSLHLRKMEMIHGTLYATSMEIGFLRFDPISQQWIPENTGLETLNIYGFCALDSVLYLSTGFGPYKAENLYQWEPWYDNMNGLKITCPKAGDGKLWVSSGRRFYSSENNGVSFSILDWNLHGTIYQGIFTDSCYYVLAGDSVFISYDEGNSWLKLAEGLPYSNPYPYLALQCLGINSDYLFLGTNYGLFRATFPDLHWEHLTSLYANGLSWIKSMVVADSIILLDKRILTSNYYDYTFRSENNGDSFDSLDVFSPFDYTGFSKYGNTYYATNLSQLYESTDEGMTWSLITVPEDLHDMAVAVKEQMIVLSGTYYDPNYTSIHHELLISYDYGTTWADIWDNLPPAQLYAATRPSMFENRLFGAASLHGVWYRDDLLTGSDEKPMKSSQILGLIPNPSDGRFDVRIAKVEQGTYTIRIFTLLGKQIHSQAVNQASDGPLTVPIHLTEIPAGIYLVMFSSPEETHSKKLVIK